MVLSSKQFLQELEENMLKPMYGLKPVNPPTPGEQGQSESNESTTRTTQLQGISNNTDEARND